jgi:hypothetical protein
MSTGSLALALLMLATGTDPTDVVPMNKRNFKIPLNPIPPAERANIKELILFVSEDQGKTWNEAAVVAPDKDGFVFFAKTDGTYLFNLCIVDAQGRRDPPDMFKAEPRYKVLVDTLKPNVKILSAARKGEEVVVRWEIQEANPDLSTLKLEYRTPDAPSWLWYTAAIKPSMNGEGSFRFTNAGPVSVRLQVMDQAGNPGGDQVEVPAKAEVPAQAVVPASSPTPAWTAAKAAPPPNWGGASGPPASSPGTVEASSRLPLDPPAFRPGVTTGNGTDRSGTIQQMSSNYNEQRTLPERSSLLPPERNPQFASGSSAELDAKAPGNVSTPSARQSRSSGSRWAANAAIPFQIANSTQVSLDYEITKVGPSGVGSVELYLTRDEGQTWDRYASDQKLRPPMVVNLPGPGNYGLRMVVSSRAGLGRRPPQPGDVPQLRLAVDTTPPEVKLYYPQPDPQRRDTLVLTWSAKDNFELALNPVTLQWAERTDGKWETIAADLPNSGRYSWQLGQNLPYRVYLRLVVRDTAGNIGVDETPEPVLIDLHEPEIQLLGLSGAPRRP